MGPEYVVYRSWPASTSLRSRSRRSSDSSAFVIFPSKASRSASRGGSLVMSFQKATMSECCFSEGVVWIWCRINSNGALVLHEAVEGSEGRAARAASASSSPICLHLRAWLAGHTGVGMGGSRLEVAAFQMVLRPHGSPALRGDNVPRRQRFRLRRVRDFDGRTQERKHRGGERESRERLLSQGDRVMEHVGSSQDRDVTQPRHGRKSMRMGAFPR
jgi:hypothetical protein